MKYEQVVFCGLSDLQLSLYRLFITSPEIKALLRGKESQPLKAINLLKKLCNHPELLDLPHDLKGSDDLVPEGFEFAGEEGANKSRSSRTRGGGGGSGGIRSEWGGKFLVLERYVSCTFAEQTPDPFLGSCIGFIRKQLTRSFSSVIILRP